jgi:hypothetical protein
MLCITFDPKYRWVAHFAEGRALVYSGKYAGFVDNQGIEVIPPKYDAAYSFGEGLAPVRKGGRWGYIDRNGQPVIPFQFDQPSCTRFKADEP